MGVYYRHTSFVQIKADHTGHVVLALGCCNITAYPMRFTNGPDSTLRGEVTGPATVHGTGGGSTLAPGQRIVFRLVPGTGGSDLQSVGIPVTNIWKRG